MPERNPFEETMRAERAGMNVPQRTTRQTRGPAGMGFAPPASTEYGEGPIRPGREIRAGFGGGPIMGYEDPTGPTRPPGQPMSGRHIGYGGPRPVRSGFGGGSNMYYEDPGMGSGSYLSSKYGGGLDDAAGMNDDARGMIEGAGFDVAGKTTDDRVSEKLWGKAVNNFPPGTPDMIIQQEWERLKKIYFDSTYGTPTLPSRGDIVGLG